MLFAGIATLPYVAPPAGASKTYHWLPPKWGWLGKHCGAQMGTARKDNDHEVRHPFQVHQPGFRPQHGAVDGDHHSGLRGAASGRGRTAGDRPCRDRRAGQDPPAPGQSQGAGTPGSPRQQPQQRAHRTPSGRDRANQA